MTRTASGPTPSLPPCMRNPELWDSSDNTEAIAACRLQCQRRFACAQEALTGPRHLVSSLNGVIAGVAIPAQNEYGTSKAHKAALKRLETIAELGRATSAATTNPPAGSQPAAAGVNQHDALTKSVARQSTSGECDELDSTDEDLSTWTRPDMGEVVVLPRGWQATRTPGATKAIPKGQVDICGAARITGLTPGTLRWYRGLGQGPKSWLNSKGHLRYWVSDVETWMAHRQLARTTPAASAS